MDLYTVAVVILVAIIAYLIFRLMRQKPKESVKNSKLVNAKDNTDKKRTPLGEFLLGIGILSILATPVILLIGGWNISLQPHLDLHFWPYVVGAVFLVIIGITLIILGRKSAKGK